MRACARLRGIDRAIQLVAACLDKVDHARAAAEAARPTSSESPPPAALPSNLSVALLRAALLAKAVWEWRTCGSMGKSTESEDVWTELEAGLELDRETEAARLGHLVW